MQFKGVYSTEPDGLGGSPLLHAIIREKNVLKKTNGGYGEIVVTIHADQIVNVTHRS